MNRVDWLNLEAELVVLQRQCAESTERIERLREDYKLSTEREERTLSRYDKLHDDHYKTVNEKNTIICDLNEKIDEMQSHIQEKDQFLDICKQKIKCRDTMLLEINDEIQSLKSEKLTAKQTIEDLRQEKLECLQTIEELGQSNLEARQTIEDLKRNLEAHKVAKGNNTVIDLETRLLRVEVDLAILLNIGKGDIKSFVEKWVASEENEKVACNDAGCKDFPNRGGNDGTDESSRTQIEEGGINNSAEKSPQPGVESRCRSPRSNGSSAYPVGSKRLRVSDSIDIIGSKDERNIGEAILKRKRSIDIDNCGLEDLDLDDKSCTDSCMNALVESLCPYTQQNIWMFRSDMQRALEEDDKFCMNAVCALYRLHILSSKSNGEFYHFDAIGGHVVAKYLIEGNLYLKLSKSVSQVKEEQPEVINQCRKLATYYFEKLFSIYHTRKDPFFKSRWL